MSGTVHAGGAGLGPGAEFDRIRSLLEQSRVPLPSSVRVGPGDDAAVLDEPDLVVSTDLSVEGVHFRREWLGAAEIGFRAVSAALSDVAAMAGEPLGVLISVALPPEGGSETWRELGTGVAAACESVGAALLGGDLARSPGPLMLDVTVLGRATEPVLRSGAQPGDELWVTGTLGGSGGAVRLWEEGRQPPEDLRKAFTRPVPRIAEARWLAGEVGLHALIDLSDGLRGDAGHIAAASGVEITLDLFLVPFHPGLSEIFGEVTARELALAGGEDYELCFAAAPGAVRARADAFAQEFRTDLTRVGTVGAGSGVYVRAHPDEPARRTEEGAFDHFAEEASE